MKDRVVINGQYLDSLDIMNPEGMFHNGHRLREQSIRDVQPLSGKLIPEFNRRQSIWDMLKRQPILHTEPSRETSGNAGLSFQTPEGIVSDVVEESLTPSPERPSESIQSSVSTSSTSYKRGLSETTMQPVLKRLKSRSKAVSISAQGKEQQSLVSFFKPTATRTATSTAPPTPDPQSALLPLDREQLSTRMAESVTVNADECRDLTTKMSTEPNNSTLALSLANTAHPSTIVVPKHARSIDLTGHNTVHDPIESKESWSRLFIKPAAPRCEGHREPCITLLTKKSGVNCGRSFWMCPRPIGPSGTKEKGTQWRCQTFVWCSDWNSINV